MGSSSKKNLEHMSAQEKVACLLVFLGEEIASQLLKSMDRKEAASVAKAMSAVGAVEPLLVERLLEDFQVALKKGSRSLSGGKDVAGAILKRAFGTESKSTDFFEHATMPAVELLRAESLASVLRREHPQTGALILAHCDPLKAGAIMGLLPPDLRTELIVRI